MGEAVTRIGVGGVGWPLTTTARRRARTLRLAHPDRLHLHSLIWSRVSRKWLVGRAVAVKNATALPMAYQDFPNRSI